MEWGPHIKHLEAEQKRDGIPNPTLEARPVVIPHIDNVAAQRVFSMLYLGEVIPVSDIVATCELLGVQDVLRTTRIVKAMERTAIEVHNKQVEARKGAMQTP